MSESASPEECANCGGAIPRRARACPSCGADERTGWRDNDATRYDGIDLPESAFEDESDPRQSSPAPPRAGLRWYWIVAAALIGAALILGLVRFR
ncbi:MAG: zinc ribbon domain-containing protein [Opitutaceae bacterium]